MFLKYQEPQGRYFVAYSKKKKNIINNNNISGKVGEVIRCRIHGPNPKP